MGYSFKWILEHLSQSFSAVSASYTATASYAFSAVSASQSNTASYVTGSIFFGNNLALSASTAITAAYALNAGVGGGGTPGGANTTIQFNSGGFFSGSNNFTFNSASNRVTLTGSMFVSGAISASFGSNTVGFFGTASWAVSASRAVTASYINLIEGPNIDIVYTATGIEISASGASINVDGIDQYLARFTGSNALETGSVYNYRTHKSLLSGDVQSLSIYNLAGTYASQSALFGTQSFIHNNVYKPTVNNAHSFGEYNANVGGNAAFNANTATTAVGDHDFVQNLLASTAPRVHFSCYDDNSSQLYAPFAGDLHHIGYLGRLNYVLVVDLVTGNIVKGTGVYYPPSTDNNAVIAATVLDANYVDYTGYGYYVGPTIQFASTPEVLVGGNLNATTNGNLVCFFLDGVDGYYNTKANHASNIGTSAHGYGTHAEGYYTQTRGHYTHAENDNTIAAGSGSTASGYRTVASGKYSNANNIFTAAGPSYFITKATIRRSNQTLANNNYYYDFDASVIGQYSPHVGNVTWIVNAELGNLFNSNGYTSAIGALRCIIQIPSLNYSGIVELFAGDYSGTKYPTTLLDILTDGVSEVTQVDVIITPLEVGTFFETQNDQFGGGPGYGAFAIGVRSIATNSGSFAGGVDSRAYGSSSMTFGNLVTNKSYNSILFGYNTTNTINDAFVYSYNGNNNLFASGGFVGINTATRPTSNYSGLIVNGTTSVGVDLYVTGSSYLGNDLNDVTRVTGSLLVSNSFELNGVGRVTGSLIVSNSLNVIGTSQVTGSQIVSSSWQLIGTGNVTGSLIVSNSLNIIGTSRVTGSLLVTGSQTNIGPFINSGSAAISGTFQVNYGTSSQPAAQVNSEGVFVLGTFSSVPTAVAGGMYFDGTDYYLGFA